MEPLKLTVASIKNRGPYPTLEIVNNRACAVNDDILETCDGYRCIDGVQGSYDVGFNFLEGGTYEVVHFLDIDGIQVWPDIFERDYVERKLNMVLAEEASNEFDEFLYS